MKIAPISSNSMNFKAYSPLTNEEINRYCGSKWAPYMEQAMTDLTGIAHTEGSDLDIIVKTTKSDNILEKGISILVAKKNSINLVDYIMNDTVENTPYVLKKITVGKVKSIDMWSKEVCDTAKSLIKIFKNYC